ncbi:hypothetical protein [Streptomyces niveus]|uniref:hypothetical protein n=1 Tax=Streptomyces niveus TaxID=193462 RepID=UPI0036901A7D
MREVFARDGNLEALGLKPNRCCSGLHEEREDAPSQWKINGDTQFDLWSSTPHLPSVEAGEQIAVGKFTPTFEFTLPGYGQFLPTEGEEGEIRFDGAARYLYEGTGDEFKDDTPVKEAGAVPIRGRPCGPFNVVQAVAVRQIRTRQN